MPEDPRELLFIYALENAVKHDSLPKAGTVIGTLMGRNPVFRSQAKEIGGLLGEVLKEVADLTPEERRERLEILAPDLLSGENSGDKVRERRLPLLPDTQDGVVMRFAPNPSGPLHLGHARAAFLNDWYVREFGGRYILRLEDTDPRRIEPENYSLLLEDIEWLDLAITDIVYQSDRLDIYYQYAKALIECGGAYVCTCDAEWFRELKLAKKSCPCRELTVEENLARWEDMLEGKYAEGMVTVRVKTDLTHPDPAIRDFSIFRIVDSPPHPRCSARVYPLMNFSVAVDDHLLGVTHVIRGKDHIANTHRQRYVFNYLGWKPPHYRHYGRMSIEGLVLSTSSMKEGIRNGTYAGWDDIRLGTLRAIGRRGIRAEAVREAMVDIGMGETDISFSWENLYAKNKAIVDPVANRYFFVPDARLYPIRRAPAQTAHAALHPNDPSRGMRELLFSGRVWLSPQDLKDRKMIRLKDLFNVEISAGADETSLAYAGENLDDARRVKAPIIQWLPEAEAVACVLRTPEGDRIGKCEPAVSGETGQMVQFERIGFARIDQVSTDRIVANYAHR